MKKIALILIAVLLMSLAACGGNADVELPEITGAAVDATNGAADDANPTEDGSAQILNLSFTFSDVELIPGAPFDPAVLPAYESIYTIPSCAGEGTDNVYNYGVLEITTFDDGTGEVIYSVYLIDPNLTTPEGLALGDTMAKAEELYGTGYVADGTSRAYTADGAMLILLVDDNGTVFSIEYHMISL